MNIFFKGILFTCFIFYSGLSNSKECPHLHQAKNCSNTERWFRSDVEVVGMYAPNSIYIGISVNFKSYNPQQVIYLDGGDNLGNIKFSQSQQEKTINRYVNSTTDLTFIYCIGNKLINEQTFKVEFDSKIICNVSKVMQCQSSPD